jgi:phage gp29-like protein
MAKKKQVQEVKPQVSFPITIVQKDNQRKSLQTWRSAKEAAESLYNPIRQPLVNLYADIIIDPHLDSVIDKRVTAITNISWSFQHDGEEIEEVTEKVLEKYFFEDLITFILESKFHGHSLIEIDLQNGKVLLVPREHVIPEFRIVVQDPFLTNEGIDYTKPPYNRTTIEVGKADDLGKLYKVAPYVLLKRGDISDWATYCEVFGQPLRVGKFDPNSPGNEGAVKKSLETAGANSWVALPIGSEFDYISDPGKTGNDTYERFANFADAAISKCIVGQTMTTEGGSSYSQSKVHMEVQQSIHQADRRFVEKILNEKFLPILKVQGFTFPDGAKFQAVDEEESQTKKERLEMDLRIHKEVANLPLSYFAEEYNVPIDKNAEPIQPPEKKKEKEKEKEKEELADDPSGGIALKNRTLYQAFLDFFPQAPK